MKKLHLLSKTVRCVACLALTSSAFAEERRVLVDKKGRAIEATLVSHPGADSGKITIRKEGKEFTVDVSTFREEEQKHLREWIAKTPPKVTYQLDLAATKTKTKEKEYAYKLAVKNDGKAPLSNFKIRYRVYMENSAGKTVFREHEIPVEGPLKEGKTAKLTTKSYNPDSLVIKDKNSTVVTSTSSSGVKKKGRSGLIGVLVRLYDNHGQLVEDWRSSGTNFKAQWPDPKSKKKSGKKPKQPEVIIE